MVAPVGMYIHVPFCVSICPYCDFVVYAGSASRGPASRISATLHALSTEIRLRGANLTAQAPLHSVYLGGGTPSLLSAAQVGRLLDVTARAFGVAADAEVTLECNPGPAERGDLAGFRAAGVNRLSIGAQSLAAAELRALGRRHSPADVRATVAEARAAGFTNVSLDLLYDVPGQTLDTWRETLDAALALEPEHVSLYALTLDRLDADGLPDAAADHLPLRSGARRWRKRARTLQDDALAADCYMLADEMLAAAGYEWYEISNWARPEGRSRHNVAYWAGAAWEAVGPGAHAFDGRTTRRWNGARLDRYLEALRDGQLPPGAAETTGPTMAAAEAAILRLRTADGLPARKARGRGVQSGLAWGRANRLLEPTAEGGLRLTLAGRLLADELFVRLLPARDAPAA